MKRTSQRNNESGMALMTTLLVMVLMSALIAGFLAVVTADVREGGVERDQTQAYAAAHAGLEKLTSDLMGLFVTDFSPNASQIAGLAALAPTLPGFTYVNPTGGSGYEITYPFVDAMGNPAAESTAGTPITAGPYQGFKGLITPYDLTVTARSSGNAEVRLRRRLQTVSVPVFQFGVFSETDLTFWGGDNFNFGGLVHTNGNLFLAMASCCTVTFNDRITAAGDVIRKQLSNGYTTASGVWTGIVKVAKGGGTFRNLANNEGSVVLGPGSAVNEPPSMSPGWMSLSIGTYKGYIRNNKTGARVLTLPIASAGATPIDLIRRPVVNSNENTVNPLVFGQRYYAQASIRILVSDNAADITSLPGVTGTAPISLGYLGTTPGVFPVAGYAHSMVGGLTRTAPFAATGTWTAPGGTLAAMNAYMTTTANQPLLNGFIKIEIQRADQTWQDVTLEILNLGITGRNLSTAVSTNPAPVPVAGNVCPEPYPNAVIRLQRFRDYPIGATVSTNRCGVAPTTVSDANSQVTNAAVTSVSPDPRDYWPNALYDTREGNIRDASTQRGTTTMTLGGIMHYVELDVANLKKWLAGTTGASGTQAWNNNGYIVYFSDRRGNRNTVTGLETGELGFEDRINPASSAGTLNGLLDVGEDVNGNGVLDMYGALPQNNYTAPMGAYLAAPTPMTQLTNTYASKLNPLQARLNRPIFFRRALKVVNGGIVGGVNNLPTAGLTVTSENPVYVQGDYNATNASTLAAPDVPAAIIADSVTILSNLWNDIRSFTSPNDWGPNGSFVGRPAANTGYRFAVASGKGLSFPKPTWEGSPYIYGTDGGVGNFLRYMEDWQTPNATVRYRGSIVSLFINRQATGAFKCCNTVYQWAIREYLFDTDFLVPAQLPPGTPMFRDVNTLTFRQLLRPTQ